MWNLICNSRITPILLSLLVFINSSVSMALPPQCRNEPISYDLGSPTRLCRDESQQPVFTNYVSQCVEKNIESVVLRREQLKLIFNTEMFYLSRIPTWSQYYKPLWEQVGQQWRARLGDAPLLEFDKKPRLGKDRCLLHFIIGRPCDQTDVTVNLLNIKKTQGEQELKGKAMRRKLPISIAYDLFEMVLMLKTLGEDANSKTLNNFVYSMAPELKVKAPLMKLLNQLSDKLGFNLALEQKLAELKKTSPTPTLQEANQVVLGILQESVSNPKQYNSIRFYESQIEFLFIRGFKEILKNLNDQIEKAAKDEDWLFSQQYLLMNAFQLAGSLRLTNEIKAYQSLICDQILIEERYENRLNAFEVVGGFIVLLTGAGLFLDLGAGLASGLMITSLGLMNAISIVDLFDAYQKYSSAKLLFGLQGIEPNNLDASEKEVLQALPWVIINLALTAPMVIINELKTAVKIAEVANDLEKVKRLKTTIKLLLGFTFAGNVPIAAYMDKEAYNILKQEWENYKTATYTTPKPSNSSPATP